MIAIEKLVLITIFLLILAFCIYLIVFFVKPWGEQANIQNQIRQCCPLYRAYAINGICPDDPSFIPCGDSNLKDLIDKASMSVYQLKKLCGC